MICSVPKCNQDHFSKNGVLKVIHGIETWKLVHDYGAMLLELLISMQNDATDNRKGAFITRFRDCKECYYKGLWVGLIATPDEIVHDASGERPWRMLAELEKTVEKTVFGMDTTLSKNLAEPGEPPFKAMNILNTSTHLTALFLLCRSQWSDDEARATYGRYLAKVQNDASHLKYVSECLKSGKERKQVIENMRNLRKVKTP